MAGRGVHEPPGSATRTLLAWALDLWPFVNGKAIASGVRLEELDAPDLMDVVHFYFEEDNTYVSAEHAKSVSGSRTQIYKLLYNKEYKYAMPDDTTQPGRRQAQNVGIDEPFSDDDIPEPFSFKKKEPPKPYVAPTQVNPDSPLPFGDIVGEPMS